MTATEDRHCGYANYETFTIAVVVDNDQGLLREIRALVAIEAELVGPDALPDFVKAWVESRFIDPVCQEGATHHGIAATLCNAALSEVDWLELAEEWLKEEGA
jgi:hypothetical protein